MIRIQCIHTNIKSININHVQFCTLLVHPLRCIDKKVMFCEIRGSKKNLLLTSMTLKCPVMTTRCALTIVNNVSVSS